MLGSIGGKTKGCPCNHIGRQGHSVLPSNGAPAKECRRLVFLVWSLCLISGMVHVLSFSLSVYHFSCMEAMDRVGFISYIEMDYVMGGNVCHSFDVDRTSSGLGGYLENYGMTIWLPCFYGPHVLIPMYSF